MAWDIVILATLISLMFIYLVLFAFGFSHYSNIPSEMIFSLQMIVYLDFLVNLNTGIYHNGIITTDRRQILQNYFSDNLYSGFLTNLTILLFQVLSSQTEKISTYDYNQQYHSVDVLLLIFLFKVKQILQLFQKLEER